jgi:hypothetical protein
MRRKTVTENSQPRIDLIRNRCLRESCPVPTKLVTCTRHREVCDGIWILHYVNQQTRTYMPGDMAVEGPNPRIVCGHLPYHVTAGWQYLYVTALRIGRVDDGPAVPGTETDILFRESG